MEMRHKLFDVRNSNNYNKYFIIPTFVDMDYLYSNNLFY